MRLLITIILLMTVNTTFCQDVAREKFSAAEIREDLSFLYKTLEQAHYNLYVNTSKEKYITAFKKLQNAIKDSMTILQAYRLFQPFTALSGIGHCNIAFPFSPSYINYVMNKGTVFPFDISVTGNNLFITTSYVQNDSIRTGDQILGINYIPAKVYLKKMYDYISGENDYSKSTQVDMVFFPRINWIVYDRCDLYHLKIRHVNGKISDISIRSIPAMEYEGAASKKKPILHTTREFKFIGNIAYLNPGMFLNAENTNISEHSAFNKGEFVHFIDSCFATTRKLNAKNLIIDLRGNPGGDNSFSDEMISYFASEQFSFCSKFYVKTSAVTKKFWENVTDPQVAHLKKMILYNEDGKVFESPITKFSPKADSLQFKGNVYVLIDRYSYSNAASSAALIQDYRFGTIIGEQTADSPTMFAAVHQFTLPATQMSITYPKAFIVRPNGNRKLRGVVPDIVVKNIPLNEQDEILDQTLKMINATLPARANTR